MQRHLRKLTSLIKNCLQSRLYKTELLLTPIEYYHQEKFFAEEHPEEPEERERVWEDTSKPHVEANTYLHIMP